MKSTFVPTFSRGLKSWVCILTLGACALSPAIAGTDTATKTTDSKSMQGVSADLGTEKDWTIELGSGATWSNVRSGQPNQAYTIVPITLSASLKVDDVSLDNFLGGWLRGYTEFFFRGDYQQIVHGPENHVEDFVVGPRYNFVQPGWKIIPYVEGGVGIGFADSKPQFGGLGQDFNFSFLAGAGAKYIINDDWFVRAGVEYQHFLQRRPSPTRRTRTIPSTRSGRSSRSATRSKERGIYHVAVARDLRARGEMVIATAREVAQLLRSGQLVVHGAASCSKQQVQYHLKILAPEAK